MNAAVSTPGGLVHQYHMYHMNGSILTVKKSGPNFVRIPKLFQETSIFRNTLDSERLVLTSHGIDQVIERNGDRARIASDISGICRSQRLLRHTPIALTFESNSLLRRVDFLGLSFIDRNLSLLVSRDVPGRLYDTPRLESADSDRGKKRGKQEIVSRRYNDYVVFV